jgi:hypothetical protein
MLTRFKCPACERSHVLDFPEDTTIFMTCGNTGKHLGLRVVNGNPKAMIVENDDGRDPFEKTTPSTDEN